MDTLIGGLDHVILAVPDLEQAATLFERSLGLAVGGGGIHPAFGTANRIVVIGEMYLELIAVQPGAQPRGFIGELLVRGQGWAGYALQTTDPLQAAAALGARGLASSGPDQGYLSAGAFSRSWQSLHLAQSPRAGLPFLIRHQTAGAERARLLAGTEGVRGHPLGAVSIAAVTCAVPDLEAARSDYDRLLDRRPADRGSDPLIDAVTTGYRLSERTVLTLAAPRTPGAGPVSQALATTGEGLFSVTIAVADLQAAVDLLRGHGIGVRVDEPDQVLVAAHVQHRQTYGARLALVPAVPDA